MNDEQTETAMSCTVAAPPENTGGIEDKVGFGIAVMNTKRRTEPYLQTGILYTSQNDQHVLAYYQIPEGTENDEVLNPLFLSVGTDMDDCLRELAVTFRDHGIKRTRWEVFPVEREDLTKIKQALGKERYAQGLSLSIHRTPVTHLIDQYQPAPERIYRKLRLEVFKRRILRRHGIEPDMQKRINHTKS